MSSETKQRSAATQAVQNIKKSLDLINTQSASDGTDDTLACELSENEDSDYESSASNRKRKITKPKRRAPKAAPIRKVVIAQKVARKIENTKQKVEALPKNAKPSFKLVPGVAATVATDNRRQKERERRKAARQVQSNCSMRLSRRLSHQLSQKNYISPQLSPIIALRLRFTPEATPLFKRTRET
jgi:hypothetical protein